MKNHISTIQIPFELEEFAKTVEEITLTYCYEREKHGNLEICNYPNLKLIFTQIRSLQNINSLRVANNPNLEEFVAQGGDECNNNGCFENTKMVYFESSTNSTE